MNLTDTTDLFRLLSDATRLRLLSLVEMEDLTVAELTKITRLPQPRVSTHLGKLRDAGLVRDRRNGSSSYYRVDPNGLAGETASLWRLLRDSTRDPVIEEDARRVREIVQERGGGAWAETVAGSMQRHYSPGRTWESLARGVVGLATLGDVVDIASGDGVLAELLTPQARSVTCVDLSPRVIAAGIRRTAADGRVTFVRGDMHRLPFADARFDHALLMSALCHASDPDRVLAETARVLRPGGRLIAVALARHQHQEAVARYDHCNLGQDPERTRELLTGLGFEVATCEITSREKRPPHFEVLTMHARRLQEVER